MILKVLVLSSTHYCSLGSGLCCSVLYQVLPELNIAFNLTPPPPPPPYCNTKLWQLETVPTPPPPPPSQLRVWMTGPLPYLKVWIRHCGGKAISNPFHLLCLFAKVTKIHTVLFATVWHSNCIAPLTKPKWGTYSAVLIDTFQVVNEVDTCFPPPIDYVSRRILHEGVNMVLDPAFLACCDCTDNCQVNWCHHL